MKRMERGIGGSIIIEDGVGGFVGED